MWLTTVTWSGAPLPRPVGSCGMAGRVYSQLGGVRNIGRNPRATLNFGGDGSGGDIVVLSGMAEVVEFGPSAVQNAAWGAKYGADWERHGMTAESFAQRFSVPLRIRITDVHGH